MVKKILENKILKIISIKGKIVRLIPGDLIFPVTNILLKSSHSFRINIFRSTIKYCFSLFWKKGLERSRRLISGERGRSLITQVWWAYFYLFWLPFRLFYTHFRKNTHFALLKDRFEVFLSFFYEVTSVGELWTDKYLSYYFDF